jgi:hypothetical protein
LGNNVLDYASPGQKPPSLIDAVVPPFAKGALIGGIALTVCFTFMQDEIPDPPIAGACAIVGLPILFAAVGSAVLGVTLFIRRYFAKGCLVPRRPVCLFALGMGYTMAVLGLSDLIVEMMPDAWVDVIAALWMFGCPILIGIVSVYQFDSESPDRSGSNTNVTDA